MRTDRTIERNHLRQWRMLIAQYEAVKTGRSRAFSGGGAQFLNVVEAVFSGMARAILHNSDYSSVGEAKAAIDRYFTERNKYFREHPKRAGNKIWGNERGTAAFSESSNHKDPRYR